MGRANMERVLPFSVPPPDSQDEYEARLDPQPQRDRACDHELYSVS
jgi:hypothetical protein